MKIDSNYKLRDVCGESVVLSTGEMAGDMSRIISLRFVAKDLWQELWGKEFEVEDIVDYMLENYEVDAETAQRDAVAWVEQLKHYGLIEGTVAAPIEQKPAAEPANEAPKKRGFVARILGRNATSQK